MILARPRLMSRRTFAWSGSGLAIRTFPIFGSLNTPARRRHDLPHSVHRSRLLPFLANLGNLVRPARNPHAAAAASTAANSSTHTLISASQSGRSFFKALRKSIADSGLTRRLGSTPKARCSAHSREFSVIRATAWL